MAGRSGVCNIDKNVCNNPATALSPEGKTLKKTINMKININTAPTRDETKLQNLLSSNRISALSHQPGESKMSMKGLHGENT